MMRQVLLVDDDSAVRDALTQTLELAEMEPFTSSHYMKVDVPDYDYVHVMPYHALQLITAK